VTNTADAYSEQRQERAEGDPIMKVTLMLLAALVTHADHARTCMPRKLDRTHSHSTSRPLHQNCPTGHFAPDMDSPVSRNTRYSKASALVRRYVLRQGSDMIQRHNRELGSGAERTVPLVRLLQLLPHS
jgi:hypothetical protein